MGTPRVVYGDEQLAYAAGSTSENVAPLGTKLVLPDARAFRMAQCDTSTALVVAQLTSSPAPSTNTKDEDVGAIAAGERVLTSVECTSGDQGLNDFRNGYLIVKEAAQLDPIHRIDSNDPINATASDRIASSMTLASPLQDAIGGSEKITYVTNPWRQIVIHAAPPVGLLTGVTARAMAVNVYGWVATAGTVLCKQDGALIVGGGCAASASVNGTIIAWIPETGSNSNAKYVGTALFTNATTTSNGVVFLRLDNN